jgi:hypothetical protein
MWCSAVSYMLLRDDGAAPPPNTLVDYLSTCRITEQSNVNMHRYFKSSF